MTGSGGSEIGARSDADAPLPEATGMALGRTVVLVGLMGAGKTTVGRRLAHALGMGFVDADDAIAEAAGRSIPDIFAERGECEFRRGERQVIARLLEGPPLVLATGGGAFMDSATRALIKDRAISIWLKTPLDVLMKRVAKRDGRPLLKEDDPRAVMQKLMDERHPIYAEADIVVETGSGPHNTAVALILEALRAYLAGRGGVSP